MSLPNSLRKQPKQARSRATVEMVLEAAARILETEGFDGLNTNAVAARAGVSIGSLYQYFPDREAILQELVRRERSILAARLDAIAAASALTWPEALDRLVGAAVEHQLARPRLALALEYADHMVLPAGESDAFNGLLVPKVGAILARYGWRVTPQGVRDLVAAVRGVADAAGLAGEEDRASLAVRLHRVAEACLTAIAEAAKVQ